MRHSCVAKAVNMFESTSSGEERAMALRALLPPDAALDASPSNDPAATVLNIAPRGQDIVVTFHWMAYPHRLAYAIGPHSEYNDDAEVEEPERWADDALTWLQEQLGTGLVLRGARRRDGDIIELTEPGWLVDHRFYTDSIQPAGEPDRYAWDAIHLFQDDGFDTTTVQALRSAGTLISWERSYLNNRTGSPYVGHAATATVDADTAELVYCDTRPDVPRTVTLDLCLAAVHQASWRGARRVLTSLDDPILDVLGFRDHGDGRELDTSFLDVDYASATWLLDQTRRWRPSRDIRRRRQSRSRIRVGT